MPTHSQRIRSILSIVPPSCISQTIPANRREGKHDIDYDLQNTDKLHWIIALLEIIQVGVPECRLPV